MSRERRQEPADVVTRPPLKPRDPSVEAMQELFTSEGRLGQAIRNRRGNPVELDRLLGALPAQQRPAAGIVLIRELGPDAGRQAWERVFGPMPSPAPEPGAPDTAAIGARTHLNHERARELRDRLSDALGEMQPDADALRRALLNEAPDVAYAALNLLRRSPVAPGSITSLLDVLDAFTGRLASRLLAAPPPSLPESLRATFGDGADVVDIVLDSWRPGGAEAAAVDQRVYVAPGRDDFHTDEGRIRLGHEVAHVIQQRRGADLPNAPVTPSRRRELESEAEAAGRAFARRQSFSVRGRAPAPVPLFRGESGGGSGGGGGASAEVTTVDLRATGGKIPVRAGSGASGTSGSGSGHASSGTGGSRAPSTSRDKVLLKWGDWITAPGAITVERDAQGNATRFVGANRLESAASDYLGSIGLQASIDSDHYVNASATKQAASILKIPGLTPTSGDLKIGFERGHLAFAANGVTLELPKRLGTGTLSASLGGGESPIYDVALRLNVPRLKEATLNVHADKAGLKGSGTAGVEIQHASGSVSLAYERSGDKAFWSGTGKVGYQSERLGGDLSVNYNSDGEVSGEGNLNFKVADFLTGKVNVALDKKGHVTLSGEIRPPDEVQLFPERKVEGKFFHFGQDIPLWGVTIPVVGSVGLVAEIHADAGFRVGVGRGVLRNTVLSGRYSTDPDIEPAFSVTGEIWIPAFAELLVTVGGGVRLSALVASIGAGIDINGRAGFYGGISVTPTLAYEQGKYNLRGRALMAADAALAADLSAFVKLEWLGGNDWSWIGGGEKRWDWKLAEWHKQLGIGLGLEADLNYTLGQPLSPDVFKLKRPDSIDVQSLVKSAMPREGMPQNEVGGARNQKQEFHQTSAPPPPSQQPSPAQPPSGAGGLPRQQTRGAGTRPAPPPATRPAAGTPPRSPSSVGPAPNGRTTPTQKKIPAPAEQRFPAASEAEIAVAYANWVRRNPNAHNETADTFRSRMSSGTSFYDFAARGWHALKDDYVALAKANQGNPPLQPGPFAHKMYGGHHMPGPTLVPGFDPNARLVDQVPKKLVEPHPVSLKKVSPELGKELAKAQAGAVLYDKGGTPKDVTKQLLAQHPDAKFDDASGTLTLPPLVDATIAQAHSLKEMASSLAQKTGVSRVTLQKEGKQFHLRGEINPPADLVTLESVIYRGSVGFKVDGQFRQVREVFDYGSILDEVRLAAGVPKDQLKDLSARQGNLAMGNLQIVGASGVAKTLTLGTSTSRVFASGSAGRNEAGLARVAAVLYGPNGQPIQTVQPAENFPEEFTTGGAQPPAVGIKNEDQPPLVLTADAPHLQQWLAAAGILDRTVDPQWLASAYQHSEQAICQWLQANQQQIAQWIRNQRDIDEITELRLNVHTERAMCRHCAASVNHILGFLDNEAGAIAAALRERGQGGNLQQRRANVWANFRFSGRARVLASGSNAVQVYVHHDNAAPYSGGSVVPQITGTE